MGKQKSIGVQIFMAVNVQIGPFHFLSVPPPYGCCRISSTLHYGRCWMEWNGPFRDGWVGQLKSKHCSDL